jgi:hypothetical protein
MVTLTSLATLSAKHFRHSPDDSRGPDHHHGKSSRSSKDQPFIDDQNFVQGLAERIGLRIPERIVQSDPREDPTHLVGSRPPGLS